MKSRLVDHISPEMFNDTFIKVDYSAYAMNQVSRILSHGIDDQSVSRKEVEAITIDWATSLDLDDAIWVERKNNGYVVWIHISDVSEAIPLFSPLDIEALHRTTSIYRREHILDMLPPELSNNLLSLEPYWGEKLTLSLQIDLDVDGNITQYDFYESRFKNIKRYDYEQFWEDFISPEAEHYKTLHLLKELSDKLRAKRLQKWWILHFNDDNRRLSIGSKKWEAYIDPTTRISHDIIESLMVLANTVTGQYLSLQEWVPLLYKRHDHLQEASFYHHRQSQHKGLAVENYTHFTSPIRRYVDIVIHRIIKALLRDDEIPYQEIDTKFVAEHSNNTRWKVEALWRQIDMNEKGRDFLERTTKRLGRPLEVYDMKQYIRNSTDRSLRLPELMRTAIEEKIQKGKMEHWIWSVGVILVWQEETLKQLIRKRVLEDGVISYSKFLSVLWDTQILRWEPCIFDIQQYNDEESFWIDVTFHGQQIVSVRSEFPGEDNIPHLADRLVRRKVIEDIFEYFSSSQS